MQEEVSQLPHNKNLEDDIIGHFLVPITGVATFSKYCEYLSEDVFYYSENRIIFSHMYKLFSSGHGFDTIIIENCLKFCPKYAKEVKKEESIAYTLLKKTDGYVGDFLIQDKIMQLYEIWIDREQKIALNSAKSEKDAFERFKGIDSTIKKIF